MEPFTDERKLIESLRAQLSSDRPISKEQLEQLILKFEDTLDVVDVSFKIIDHLVRSQKKEKKAD